MSAIVCESSCNKRVRKCKRYEGNSKRDCDDGFSKPKNGALLRYLQFGNSVTNGDSDNKGRLLESSESGKTHADCVVLEDTSSESEIVGQLDVIVPDVVVTDDMQSCCLTGDSDIENSSVDVDGGKGKRPTRRATRAKISYQEMTSSDDNDTEDHRIPSRKCENTQQMGATITRYFSLKLDSQSQACTNDGGNRVQESETSDQSLSRSECESDCVPVVESVLTETDDENKRETDYNISESSPDRRDQSHHQNCGETRDQSDSPNEALPSLSDHESFESDFKDVPQNVPITKFFASLKQPDQQSLYSETAYESEEDQDDQNDDMENENRKNENGGDRDVDPRPAEVTPITHFFAPIVKASVNSQAERADDEDAADSDSNSDISDILPKMRFFTPVLKPVQIPMCLLTHNEPEGDIDKNDDNWDVITEVLNEPSSKRLKRSNSGGSRRRERSISALLSRIRKVQKSASKKAALESKELTWTLEVEVLDLNYNDNLANVLSSEESSDEDYARIVQEEQSMLRLFAPVTACESHPSENVMGDDSSSNDYSVSCRYQTRKRHRILSIPDSDDDVDNMTCDVSQQANDKTPTRGKVSDGDVSGDDDSRLGCGVDKPAEKIDENQTNINITNDTVRQRLTFVDNEEQPKCTTMAQQKQRKKVKRRYLVSKQEQQEAMESRRINNKSMTDADVKAVSSLDHTQRRSTRLAATKNTALEHPQTESSTSNAANVMDLPANNKKTRTKTKSSAANSDTRQSNKTKKTADCDKPPHEALTQLFPIFCKPNKEAKKSPDIANNTRPPIDTTMHHSDVETCVTLPQSTTKKNTDGRLPVDVYMPFPKVSHVLQYGNERNHGDRTHIQGYVMCDRSVPTDSRPPCCESLQLGSITACRCTSNPVAVNDVTPIGDEERRRLATSLATKSSIDIQTLYDKYVDRLHQSGNDSNLWCGVFAPCSSNELAVDRSAVTRLHKWLNNWQERSEGSKKSKNSPMKTRVTLDDKKDLDWLDDDDFVVIRKKRRQRVEIDSDSEEEEEAACKAVLLLGHHGSGKTSAVYACAKELGLTVIEVNTSSKRSGKSIQSSLTEATRSHHVPSIDMLDTKPTATKQPNPTSQPQQKATTLSISRLHPAFASFVKKTKSGDKAKATNDKKEMKRSSKRRKAVRDLFVLGSQPDNDVIDEAVELAQETRNTKNAGKDETLEQAKCGEKAAKAVGPTVVLLDEVDVLFENENGFWSAVSSIVETAKRPVIMTAVDKAVTKFINFQYDVIQFEQLDDHQTQMTALLQLMCLAQGVNVDPAAIETLVEHKRGDIRSCIHTLQFWCSTTNVNTTTLTPDADSVIQPVGLDLSNKLSVCLSTVLSESTGDDVNKDGYMCDTHFLNTCESFQRIKQIYNLYDLDIKRLLPFLFNPSKLCNKEAISSTPANTTNDDPNELENSDSLETPYDKVVCRAKLDILARWCDSMSVKDSFQCSKRFDCRSCEEPSLVDCHSIESGGSDEPLRSELHSCLDVASVNSAHVQFAGCFPTVYSEMGASDNGELVLDTAHLIRTNRNNERRLVNQLCTLNELTTNLPPHSHISRDAITTDYWPAIRAICSTEESREHTHKRRRFKHYFHYWLKPDIRRALTKRLSDTQDTK